MPQRINERRILLGLALISLAVFLFAKARLYPTYLLISEKGLGLLFLALLLLVSGFLLVTKAIKKAED
jgi:hypothetical protein